LKVAFVGMMQSGKSTLLAAVSGKPLPQVGSVNIEELIVPVPDERLDWLTKLYQPHKTVHGTVDCLDLPGLSFEDEHGRAAARRFLSQVRTVDLFVLIIGAYAADADPVKDLINLKTELMLADLELVCTRIERLEKQVNKPSKTQAQDKAELEMQKRLQEAIESEKPIRSAIHNEQDLAVIKSLGFFTLKPMMVVINVAENQRERTFDLSRAIDPATQVVTLCAPLEYELSQLDEASRKEFMSDLGITRPAVAQFMQSCYSTLGLISFLTVGKDEVRAWPIPKGISAHDAAGKVHSDIKRGFIRAETIAYTDIQQYGDEKGCKAAGKMRLEGKTYIVQDGDIINYRFNV
jgi:GTP-binding protein YchF